LGVGLATIAATANSFNLLDVVPGRALKAFLPTILAVGLAAGGPFEQALGIPLLPIAAVLLMLDLSERGMLGDSGANVLGFIVGIGLFLSLSTTGLVVALAILLLVHVVSETVTLSRVIEAVPPLKWLDRLGRL
jgi:hypothetical protein